MDITYKKINNANLFRDFEDENLLNMETCQNYVPLYNNFFTLNENNYNSINLNSENNLHSLIKKVTENIFLGKIQDENNNIVEKQVFFKLCPLLDPFKYLAGKYDICNNNLLNLPKLNSDDCHFKVNDINNASYVDSFFTYLTSQLYNRMNFYHGVDFYGSYLGCKQNLHIDIGDDIDMLIDSDFFHNNTNKLYTFINSDHEDLFNEDTRSNKKRLNIDETTDPNSTGENIILNLDDIESLHPKKSLDNIESFDSMNTESGIEIFDISSTDLENVKISGISDSKTHNRTNSTNSDYSSRSSNTQDSEDRGDSEDSEDSENEEYSDESSDVESVMVSLNRFPIQIIALENCHNTLDHLFIKDKLSQEQLGSVVIQILMMLITYQKLFNLTHNDLHTNNIMYVETEKTYLYYKVNNKHYKVKTFGKIYKIIDFGRAIYQYKNKVICSDSFHKDGDATTQYNCEPYYNKDKPRLEPNYSFDLCRLGCSIYDFITEKYETLEDIHWPIHKLIMRWCDDDDGRSILYKNDGEERYPDFKLYKMIARKVHNHVPINELNHKFFNRYIVPKKEIKKGSKIWNIDILE